MPYQKTQWINNNEPSINAQNLNKIEQGIYDNSIAVETQEGLLDGHTVRADVPSNAVFTDTTYTAGQNVQINGTTISATDTIYDDTALTERVQDNETDITALQTEIGTTVKWSEMNVLGAKNLIPYPYNGTNMDEGSHTVGGITYYIDSNGITYSAGTCTSSSGIAQRFISDTPIGDLGLKVGDKVILSGDASANTTIDLQIRAMQAGGTTIETKSFDFSTDLHNELEWTIPDNTALIRVWTFVARNEVIPTVKIQPMVRLASIKNGTWVPYAMTNRDLTVKKANTSILGTDESGNSTASQAYAQGDYFVKDGQFCKALTSIASGATFTLNTNYAAYTLADILKAIENL